MTATTDFIAELMRAANEINRVGVDERTRLLRLAVHRIHDLRISAGIPSSGTGRDALSEIRFAGLAARHRADDEVRSALLKAAEMIRDLRIIIYSEVDLNLTAVER